MTDDKKRYLGDGAYYAFDGSSVKLTTSDGLRTTNTVYLDPECIAALLEALSVDFDPEKLVKIIRGRS